VAATRREVGVMRRVFISFIIEDENAVKGLRLLAKNPGYSDLEFYDESVRVPINSVDAPYIKGRIREKIRRCGVILCLISNTTYTSSWVNWELQTAIEMEKPIVAMAVKGWTEQPYRPQSATGASASTLGTRLRSERTWMMLCWSGSRSRWNALWFLRDDAEPT
jgi:hypothetical protein